MQVPVSKWGNSLGLRVPRHLAVELGLAEGSKVDIEVQDRRLIVTPAGPSYTLAGLLKDTTPEDYRRMAVDWGPDLGREMVD